MNVIENDVLFAEFMQLKLIANNTKCENPRYMDGTISPIQFHSSWDWLIPLVEACNKKAIEMWESETCYVGLTDAVNKLYKAFAISLTDKRTSEQRRKETYQACIKFIKWYNENLNK